MQNELKPNRSGKPDFSVPTEKGKKVLTDAIFLPNKEAEEKGNRLSGWNCQSNPQKQCPVIPAGL